MFQRVDLILVLGACFPCLGAFLWFPFFEEHNFHTIHIQLYVCHCEHVLLDTTAVGTPTVEVSVTLCV